MKIKFVLALAALLMTFGLVSAPKADATPAGYFYLANGGSVTLNYHGCRLEVSHGTFGNTAFSRIAHLGGCSVVAGVQTESWGKKSNFCTFSAEMWGLPDYNDCDLTDGNSVLQSITPGYPGLLGTVVRLVPYYDVSDYVYLRFSPIA